jgi:hypothetical protein
MKNSRTTSIALVLAIGSVAIVATKALAKPQSGPTNVIRSTFIMPSDPKEGRDPFFPNSTRPYKTAVTVSSPSQDISSLVIKGFSGSVDHRLVIINNHTFATGDEGDVITSIGRIHLRCIEIRTNSVVIDVGGQIHELFYFDRT